VELQDGTGREWGHCVWAARISNRLKSNVWLYSSIHNPFAIRFLSPALFFLSFVIRTNYLS
jgi:hypothetical protein